jgi:hypothetical protein
LINNTIPHQSVKMPRLKNVEAVAISIKHKGKDFIFVTCYIPHQIPDEVIGSQ